MTINSIKQAQDRSYDQAELDQVMVELDQLKRQSERLRLVNSLHGRLAGILDVGGMIEAYSVWLMPLVSHELIGYSNNTRNKKHFFCSSHGPQRRQAIDFAEKLVDCDKPVPGEFASDCGHYAHRWVFETSEDAGILLILKRINKLTRNDIELINLSLEVLVDSLQRGVEYEELFEKASSDALTGLANRRVFEERIQAMMDSSRRYENPLSMISMDLDYFKEVNDNFGHQRGDEVLCEVANVLRDCVRTTDLLVRMGGDEFVVVLENTDLTSGRMLAERLCAAVNKLDIRVSDTKKLGVSIGLTELSKSESLREWQERTDDILYHAKAEGRARVAVE